MRRKSHYIGIKLLIMLAAALMAAPASAKGSASQAVTKQQIKSLKKQEHRLLGTLNFFKNPERRWMLHLNQQDKPCWKVKLSGPEQLCSLSRGAVRISTQRLAVVRANIGRLEQRLLKVGNVSHWNCIYRYERHPRQGWQTKTGNGYYGGLQMDMTFQRTYGPEYLRKYGTADKWPPIVQMAVAQRAKDSGRGYYPWPNTARYCGLI